MVRQENIETALKVTSIIPASTVNSDHDSTIIITQDNQPEPISPELINLDINNTLQKEKYLPNSRFFSINYNFKLFNHKICLLSYNPSRSSQTGRRRDYGRSQSVTEGQGSVDDFQINTLCHSEADNTGLPANRADTSTRSLSGRYTKPAIRPTTVN
ncbi:hypothetical protein O181_033496 [Austropuccinia psidii MF-1]|uniref:Uncharacterized protein n=1 Tax=Austropuccinia psidii MF-1 TaxID=1389203 RepID=A0A9Q3H754_9BASI|nr:hypothetical protein [Austropuccinia psidii MF-1]